MKKVIIVLFAFFIVAMASPAMALDLGKGITLDGYATAGKLFDIYHQEIGNYDRYSLTSEKGSWYATGELGIRYNNSIVRPFIGYETLTNHYDQKTLGTDLFLYGQGSIAVGLRGSYIHLIQSGMTERSMVYSGLILKW